MEYRPLSTDFKDDILDSSNTGRKYRQITNNDDLRIYIRSLESKEDVEKVTYGMDIPEAYQSEPLKAMMAQKS